MGVILPLLLIEERGAAMEGGREGEVDKNGADADGEGLADEEAMTVDAAEEG